MEVSPLIQKAPFPIPSIDTSKAVTYDVELVDFVPVSLSVIVMAVLRSFQQNEWSGGMAAEVG